MMKVASVALVALVISVWSVGCGSGVKTTGEKSIYAAAESGDTGAVREGLKNGFKVNTPDAQGMTLLHHAAQGNQADLAEVLMERYAAKKNIQDAKGRTAADVAKEVGAADVLQRMSQAE